MNTRLPKKDPSINPSADGSNIQTQENQEFLTSRNPNNTMPRSRLKRSMEKQTKQQIFLMIVGMCAIIGLLAFFGGALLVKYSVFIGSMKDKQDTNIDETAGDFIAPPILAETFTATNSAQVSISGTGQEKQTIRLYLNDELKDKISVKDDGTFTFPAVSLSKGNNTIKTKAIDDKKNESGFSNTLSITYSNQAPALSIDSPADNQIVTGDNNKVTITGKTDPGVQVTVNAFWAIVDEHGNYQYNLTLQNGDNTVTVVAADKAGNKTEETRKVIYNH